MPLSYGSVHIFINPDALLYCFSPDTRRPSNSFFFYQWCADKRAVRSTLPYKSLGLTSERSCIALDPVIRLSGAISLWVVEIVMQVRVYALFDGNRKVGIHDQNSKFNIENSSHVRLRSLMAFSLEFLSQCSSALWWSTPWNVVE